MNIIVKQMEEELLLRKQEVEKVYNRKVIFIACQGSQNYNLDDEESDFDTKCITLPTLDDIVNNEPLLSVTYLRENGEHIDVKDIRLMFNMFRKQNLAYMELLFSKYQWVDPDYRFFFNLLYYHKDEIARLDQKRFVRCIYGMALEKQHALCHDYPSKKDLLEKYGYDGKQLHHIIRLYMFLEKYINNTLVTDCYRLDSQEEIDLLIKIKRNKAYSLDEALALSEVYIENIKNTVDEYCLREDISVNQNAINLLNDIQKQIIVQALKDELK